MIPMVEVFCRKKDGQRWEAMQPPINHSNKLEWFDTLEGWPKTHHLVTINGREKELDIYLSEADRGWVKWDDFSSIPVKNA